jgi:hypothetical protein
VRVKARELRGKKREELEQELEKFRQVMFNQFKISNFSFINFKI